MPGIPANITIAGRTPATIKGNLPPLINTLASARGGFRAGDDTGGGGGGGDPAGVIFSENFDNQPDYTIEQAGSGGSLAAGGNIPDNWSGVYNGTNWSPETGDADNHGSFEIMAADSAIARGGSGKCCIHYRESSTQRVISPDEGAITADSGWSHIRIWMSTSPDFSTAKTATATVNGTDYTFSATTGANGATYTEDTTPSLDSNTLGPVDTQFNSVTNKNTFVSTISNAIAIPSGATISVVGGDIVGYNGEWRARTKQFVSDSQLIKAPIDTSNPSGTDELYVEFWLKFSPDWYYRRFTNGSDIPDGWMSKIFRCASVVPGGNIYSGGSDADLGPMLYWDYQANSFGVRNNLAKRGGPPPSTTVGNNYKVDALDDMSGSQNYNQLDLAGQEVGGTDPQLPDLVNGGLLAESTTLVTHEMIFGPASKWTKVAFYVKMNTSAGATDGIMSQYIDGHRIRHLTDVPWCPANSENAVSKWNHFSIGGNDSFHPFPNADKYEDWYAIDDIVVRNSLPGEFI